MPFTYIRRAAAALALIATVGCTVHDTSTPPLTGPSGLALSLTVNAIPDSISQDGGSQSSVKITAIGPDGRGLAALPLRLDMFVNGVAQDYGTLSARSVVTNGDGVATAVYTAPPSPVNGVFGTCSGLPGNCVSIVATATATNFATANPEQVQIRLVPTGVILPPAGLPVASFAASPTPAQMNVPVTFDASASKPGTGATSISSYSWNFGDGTPTGTGRSVIHTFTSQQAFNVTLTVTNDRGLSASVTIPTVVGAVAAATLKVVYSPASPQVGQAIVFNAEQSAAAPGHSLSDFNWNFGDGSTGAGSTATHAFASAGTYNVVLSALDDTGQRATTSIAVTVSASGGAGGGGLTTAAFTFSPQTPAAGQSVFFNGAGSTAATGHTLTTYAWDFGDGTNIIGAVASTSHVFLVAGAFNVTLTVYDDTPTPGQNPPGQKATVKQTVTVSAAGAGAPSSKFTSSPVSPGVSQQVVFDASTSTAAQGLTIADYAWVFGDGTPIIHTTSKTIAHSFAFANTFIVSLTVTDSVGVTNSSAAQVIVGGAAGPNANFTFSPAVGVAGADIAFTSTSTPSAGASSILSYTWNFGDGSALDNTSGANVPHRFAAGIYSVTLTVTDNLGKTATVSKTVTVQ